MDPPNDPTAVKYDGFFTDPASLPKEVPERRIRKVPLNAESEIDFEEAAAEERNAPSARQRSTCSQSQSGTRARRGTRSKKNRKRRGSGGGHDCSDGKCKLRRDSGSDSRRRRNGRNRRESTARNRRESNQSSRRGRERSRR